MAGTVVLGFLSPLVENFVTKNNWFAAMSVTVEETIVPYGHFLSHTFGFEPPTFWITLGILAAGGIPAIFFFMTRKWDSRAMIEKSKFLKGINTFLYKRWYMNTAIYWCLRKFKRFAELTYEYFDLKVIDRTNYVIASGTMKTGEVVRKTQTGILSVNFIYMLLGAIILLAVLLFTI